MISNYLNSNIHEHVDLSKIFCINSIDVNDLNISHPSTISVSKPATGVVLSASVEIIQILKPSLTRIPGGPFLKPPSPSQEK